MSITEVKKHATRISNGRAKVQPGEPFHLNEAASVGDGVWQGDLGVEIVASLPRDYVQVESHPQLVPGSTIGSRHALADTSTVSGFCQPKNWGDKYDGLDGPAFHCDRETTITHPTHGNVVIAAGHTVRTRYQRQYDAELKKERRALD